MQTATVFDYENDLTERMKDLFEILSDFFSFEDQYPFVNFPLELDITTLTDNPTTIQAYADMLVELKARMFYGTSIAIID